MGNHLFYCIKICNIMTYSIYKRLILKYLKILRQLIDDKNFPFTPTHVQKDNVVFMPYDDNERTCFNDLVMEKYGSIDAEWMVNTLSPSHKTGNTHMVSYNYNTR